MKKDKKINITFQASEHRIMVKHLGSAVLESLVN